jgi:hypothetical protein
VKSIHSIRAQMKRFATAIAAVAAVLVLASPVRAEIIYHKVDIVINEGTYNLDLNGDGVTDFAIVSQLEFVFPPRCPGRSLYEQPASENGAIVGPLKKGNEIGPHQAFSENIGTLAFEEGLQGHCMFKGPWAPAATGYLGLSFTAGGNTYYGWALLEVEDTSATLTGYAYEATPGMPIEAGQTE